MTRDKHDVGLSEVCRVFLRIGLLSFGGPAAQIALMHRELVDDRDWLTEQQFLNALSFRMLLPGPEAMQLATYSGWRVHGVLGGLLAGLLFVLPGAIVILVLASLYVTFGEVSIVDTLFVGVQAAAVVIVIDALIKVTKRALITRLHWGIAVGAFIAIFFFAVPFPAIILAAGCMGALFSEKTSAVVPDGQGVSSLRTFGVFGLGAIIWAFPFALIAIWDANPILYDLGAFFSKLAVVTFGGAYAVLAYMVQDVVTELGWLTATEVMDGLGLAETTPGPLILVTQFVGFLAAFKEAGYGLALAGAAVTLWVTFVPCFVWIFAGAPYVERLSGQPMLGAALKGITAAVVGVILNLSLWFFLHVMFADVAALRLGIMTVWVPELASVRISAVLLILAAGALLFWAKWGVARMLGASALAAVVLDYAVA